MHIRPGIGPGMGWLPFEDFPSLFLSNITLGNGRTQRFCQPLNSEHQRFYRLAARNCFLG